MLIRLIRVLSLDTNLSIIIDRYYGIDAIVCPRRHTGRISKIFVKFLFPPPLGVILLEGSSEKIRNRKSDMEESEIDESLMLYKKYLINEKIPFYSIDTVMCSIDECVIKSDEYISKNLNNVILRKELLHNNN